MSSHVSAVIRRAVLFQISMAAPGLVACGGSTALSASADAASDAPDGSASTDTGSDAPAGEASAKLALCSVIPNTPPFNASGTCIGFDYQFNGTSAECGGDDGGAIPLSACETMCPAPPPADEGGSLAVGLALSSCAINECYLCGPGPSSYQQLSCGYGVCAGTGRRPSGLRPCPRDETGRPCAAFLAQMAYLEAASVVAFERLARELGAHRAPMRLQRAALRASHDEVRHTRLVTALANRLGTSPSRPRMRRGPVRSLAAVAVENAIEGCVRETFGAAIAMTQALTASDLRVRVVMHRIGSDEMRHAELAWSVARWLEGRLDTAGRARVARARRRAARQVLRDASRPVDANLVCELGLPAAREARGIALALASALWNDSGVRRPSV